MIGIQRGAIHHITENQLPVSKRPLLKFVKESTSIPSCASSTCALRSLPIYHHNNLLSTRNRGLFSCSKSGIPLIVHNNHAAGWRDICGPVYGKELKRRDNRELQDELTTGCPLQRIRNTQYRPLARRSMISHPNTPYFIVPHRTRTPLFLPRYGTETTVFVFKGISSHSVQYVPLLKARCHFQESSQSSCRV